VTLESDPDPILAASLEIIATADSVILDRCSRWFGLAGAVILAEVPGAWVVDLSGEGAAC